MLVIGVTFLKGFLDMWGLMFLWVVAMLAPLYLFVLFEVFVMEASSIVEITVIGGPFVVLLFQTLTPLFDVANQKLRGTMNDD